MLSDRVLSTVIQNRMVRPGEGVLVAVSGGRDSIALLQLLVELRERGAAPFGASTRLAIGHVHHGLRPEADDDEAFCRQRAQELELRFESIRVDVRGEARREGLSLEDAARTLRYRALDELARKCHCPIVAVGHTQDDQAETFLLRLLRGAGTKGLSAAHPVVENRIVRPLIDVRRSEIADYVEEASLSFREDASNRDLRFTRNRLRTRLMPSLVEHFNPRIVEALASSASLLRDEEDYLAEAAGLAMERALIAESEASTVSGSIPGSVSLSVEALHGLHVAMKRRVIRMSLQEVRGDLRGIGRSHVEAVLGLLAPGKSGRRVQVPQAEVERSFDELRFQPPAGPAAEQAAMEPGYNSFEYRLTIPTRLRVFESGGTLVATHEEAFEPREPAAAGDSVVVAMRGGAELYVRNPIATDRFRPLGAPGSKPLRRYLMERRVDKSLRQRVPLIVSRSAGSATDVVRDEVLWVVGHGVSEAARVRTGSKRLRLVWTRSEGTKRLLE